MSKFKHYSLFLIFETVLLSLLASGCNDVINENVEALYSSGVLATKSVPVVCVDLYVQWNGQFIYLGTACSGGGSSGGASGSIAGGYNPDDVIESPPYSPGGTPDMSGGSQHYNPSTQKQEYKFELLTYLYDVGSTLDLKQKSQLVVVVKNFLNTNTGKILYHFMVNNKIKIKFHYDPNLNYAAIYNTATQSISISDFSSLRIHEIGEEIIHAVQHQYFYKELMVSSVKNYEFEAKVYQDLAAILDEGALMRLPTATDNRSDFTNAYDAWITDIEFNQHGRFTDESGFNELCDMWIGYPGVFVPTFSPLLLRYFFRKPIPPQPPFL